MRGNSLGSPLWFRSCKALPSCARGRDLTNLSGYWGSGSSLTLWMFCQAQYSVASSPPLLPQSTGVEKWEIFHNNNTLCIMRTHTQAHTGGGELRGAGGGHKGERERKKRHKWCDVTEWNATQPVTYLYNINYTAQCLWIMEQPYLTRVNNLAAAWPIVYITRSISAKHR